MKLLGIKFQPKKVLLIVLLSFLTYMILCKCNKKSILENMSEMNKKKESMLLFDDSDFKPECCDKSDYASSLGCSCLNGEPSRVLFNRGGNKASCK